MYASIFILLNFPINQVVDVSLEGVSISLDS